MRQIRLNKWAVILLLLGIYLPIERVVEAQSRMEQELKVGFIGALTGPVAAYGLASQNGFEMAIKEFGADKIKVYYEDDQYAPAKTVAAFRKLSEIDKVDVIISLASTPSNAIAPLAEQMKLPLFSWANDPKVSRGRSYVIMTEQSATVEGNLISDNVIKRGYESIAYLTSVGDYQSAVAEGIKQRLSTRLIYQEEVSSDERDFRTIALKIKNKNPGAIGMCLHPGQFGILAKQLRAIEVKVPLFGCNTMQDSNEIVASAGALNGAWFVSISVDPDFERRYVKQFGNNNVISGAAIHYELGKVLAEITSNNTRGKQIIEKLFQLGNKSGAAGSFEIVRKDNLQYFNIDMIVKSVD